jgi:hypothetical protein
MKAGIKDSVIWISTRYVKNEKTCRGVSKLVIRYEVGVAETVKAFFASYGITDYRYKAFSSFRKAARHCMD